MSSWIWRFGDFEMFHHLQVQGRRRNRGANYPSVWKLYSPEPTVRFKKDIKTEGGHISIRATGPFRVVLLPEMSTGGYSMEEYIGTSELDLHAGEYSVIITVQAPDSFGALYVSGLMETDDTWEADDVTSDWTPAECSPLYTNPDVPPTVFAFDRKVEEAVATENINGGVLYDYGKELMAELSVTDVSGRNLVISFGESREEALDVGNSEVCEFYRGVESAGNADVSDATTSAEGAIYGAGTEVLHELELNSNIIKLDQPLIANPGYIKKGDRLHMADNAFRYLFISEAEAKPEVISLLPKVDCHAGFTSSDAKVTQLWNTAAYTFLLNDREFFLDGIKRDRWVWSADAYQSLFVDHYLLRDREAERRTLIALGGRLPVKQYINTIMDYSYFWLMSLWEYYAEYGDVRFLELMYPRATAVMEFCDSRRSVDGYVRGRVTDWVFIDWAEMDKSGALLGEQILLSIAMRSYSRLQRVLREHNSPILRRFDTSFDWDVEADVLEEHILADFWDEELQAFVDCHESGLRHVTRQNNILALLYLHCDDAWKQKVYHSVLENDAYPPITTPYFRFYEMRVKCRMGHTEAIEDLILNYFGPMLDQGATTCYEEFNPELDRISNYAMYNRPYGKSLCHAWSTSPVYLLGRYRLGVKRTDIAWKSFEVRPVAGPLSMYDGVVPIGGGEVHVHLENGKVTVTATREGGTLVLGEKRIALPAGEAVTEELA